MTPSFSRLFRVLVVAAAACGSWAAQADTWTSTPQSPGYWRRPDAAPPQVRVLRPPPLPAQARPPEAPPAPPKAERAARHDAGPPMWLMPAYPYRRGHLIHPRHRQAPSGPVNAGEVADPGRRR